MIRIGRESVETSRRAFSGRRVGCGVAVRLASASGAEEVRRRRDRHRDQDRPHQSLQRPGLGLWRDRQGASTPTGRASTTPAASTAARSSSSPSTTATPAQDGRGGPPAGRAGQGLRAASTRSARRRNTAIHKYMNQKKVPQLYVATGASKWGDPKEFPWTMGYQPDYHTEGGDLRQAHPGQRQGRQDRRADAERRLRQGLLRRLQGRPRQGRRPDRQAS